MGKSYYIAVYNVVILQPCQLEVMGGFGKHHCSLASLDQNVFTPIVTFAHHDKTVYKLWFD